MYLLGIAWCLAVCVNIFQEKKNTIVGILNSNEINIGN